MNNTRIYVETPEGKKVWKYLADVLPNDIIQTTKAGVTIKTTTPMGRPRKVDIIGGGIAASPTSPPPPTVKAKKAPGTPTPPAAPPKGGALVVVGSAPVPAVATPSATTTPTMTISDMRAERMAELVSDPVYLALQRGTDNLEVLHNLMLALSEEAAILKGARDKVYLEGGDIFDATVKRIKALQTIGDTWLRRAAQLRGSKGVDMGSPAYRTLMQFVLETFYQALEKAGIRGEQIEAILSHLNKAMSPEWEAELKQRIKGAAV